MLFQIALVQFSPKRKNVTSNVASLTRLLKGLKADLIVLPELSNTGYLYDSTESILPYSEPNNGTGKFLSSLQTVSETTGGVIVAGYAESENSLVYNSAAAVTAEGVIANYRKTHLYSTEKFIFEPGNTGFQVLEWNNVKIGMMICFDWIFPESARKLAFAGAQIIAHPANLVLPFCQNAMLTRSLENRVFTITANRINTEKLKGQKLRFTGQSQMTAPNGEILFRGPKDQSTVHGMAINPDQALDKKISDQNDLFEDRREEYY